MSNLVDRNVITLNSLNPSTKRATLQTTSTKRPIPCVIGRNGQTILKKEGDGKTPIGIWHPITVYYRQDRTKRPETSLPVQLITQNHGWCDDPNDRNYNRPVPFPYPTSAETLWRDDELYNLIVVLDHNQCPRIKGKGSAIFMHVAKPEFPPTEGCIAMEVTELHRLLPYLNRRTKIII